MTKALELAKFGRETPPTGVVVGDSDAQTLSSKTFSDGPVFSSGTANGIPYLNGSKVFTTGSALIFDGTNLGVGTSSPAAKLHVNVAGDNETTIARFGTTSTGNVQSQLKILSDPTASIVKLDATGAVANNITFLTGGTERVRFDSNGQVGVGASPAAGWSGTKSINLGLSASFYGDGQTHNWPAGIATNAYRTNASTWKYQAPTASLLGSWRYEQGNVVDGWAWFYASAGAQDSTISYSQLMKLTSGGNLGIGTNNPISKLGISGDITLGLGPNPNGSYGALTWRYGNSSSFGTAGYIDVRQVSAGNSGYMVFATNNSTPDTADATERMRILNNGNISFGSTGTADRPVHLIGTGNRQYFKSETTTNSISNEAGFEVKTPNSNFLIGSHGSTNALWIYDMNAAAERLRIDSAGLLILGNNITNTGGGRFDLTSNGTSTIQARSSSIGTGDGTTDVTVTRAVSSLGAWWANARYDAFSHTWGYGGGATGSTAMRITGAGNLAIGTTANTSQKLNVNGGIWLLGNDDANYSTLIAPRYDSSYSFTMQTRLNSTSFAEWLGLYSDSGGANPRIALGTAGWPVGVGTTGPNAKFAVQGSTELGNRANSTVAATYSTRLSGYALRYDASNRYGSYGQLIFHASTSWTGSARRWLLTNGFNANMFAIIRSDDGDTDPPFGDGGVSSNADFWITYTGQVNIKQPLYIAGVPASSLYAINVKNTNMTDNSSGFDYIVNGSSGGGTTWNIVKDSIINLYDSSGGHYGTWGRQVYLEAGYWRFKGSVRLSSTNGSIHGNTSSSNYPYNISFRFVISGGPDTGNLRWNVDSLGDGTRAAFSTDASYKAAGLYTISFNTSGYDGIKQIYITDLQLERVA